MKDRSIRLRIVRGRLLTLLVCAATAEVGWTIYLALVLPHRYVASHWDTAWVGLDIGEIVMMLCTAWAAWRHRANFILFACISATLFLVDAWFDVTTAQRGDLLVSGSAAVAVEVPFAFLLYWIAGRATRRLATLSPEERESEWRKDPKKPVDGPLPEVI